MPLNIVKINPGVVKDLTQYSAGKNGPFWVDGNNVRFRNGFPTKIGGWTNEAIYSLDASGDVTSTASSLTGVPRKMNFWRAITDGEDYLAVGTHNHLQMIKGNGIYDVSQSTQKSHVYGQPVLESMGIKENLVGFLFQKLAILISGSLSWMVGISSSRLELFIISFLGKSDNTSLINC